MLFLGSFVILLGSIGSGSMVYIPEEVLFMSYVFLTDRWSFQRLPALSSIREYSQRILKETGQGADMQLISGEKKKLLKKIDFDNVEICALQHSHTLDEFNNKQNLKISDYSSHINDRRKFALIYSKG